MAKDHRNNHTRHTPPVSPQETATASPEAKKVEEVKTETNKGVLAAFAEFENAMKNTYSNTPSKESVLQVLTTHDQKYKGKTFDEAIKILKEENTDTAEWIKKKVKETEIKQEEEAATKKARAEVQENKADEKKIEEKKIVNEPVKEAPKPVAVVEKKADSDNKPTPNPSLVKEGNKPEKSGEKGKSFWSKLNPKNWFKKKDKPSGEKKKFWDKKIGKVISAPVRIPYQIIKGTGKWVWDGVSMNVKKAWNGITTLFTGAKDLVVDNGKWIIDGPKRAWKYVTSPFRKEKK